MTGRVARGPAPWWASWREDPRSDELGRAALHHAASLVELGGDLDEATRATLLDAVLDTLLAQQHGSTRVPASEGIQALAASGAVEELLSTDENAYRPLIVTNGWLYHQRTAHYERELARRLRLRLDQVGEPPDGIEAAMLDVASTPTSLVDGTPVVLSGEQRAAVETAARLPLSVVTGGPGTGKTSIVVSLLRLLVRCGVPPERVALAAPTGKAANRLGESIATQLRSLEPGVQADDALRDAQPAPTTLHRLLRYSGTRGRFLRDEEDPIDADWVIVDEASMIDLVLMERLVSCVAPQTRLVLLGDAEQLPSVEAGTVLRDLIGSPGAAHVARLEISFRMDESDPAGRAILTLARNFREGEASGFDAAGTSLVDVPAEEMRSRMLSFVNGWFAQRVTALPRFDQYCRNSYQIVDGRFSADAEVRIGELLAHLAQFRILCLTRGYATGTDALNTAFHLRMARRAGVEGIPDYLGGEPVMMLRNDYSRGLFNGDHGIVLWVESGGELRLAAVFPHADGFRAHHLSGLTGQLTHAWAMTVHKSQGSEFDDVALVLPAEDIPLLSRELLYTAVTRARKSVQIIGPAELLELGASRAVERWSGLSERVFDDRS